MIFFHIVSSLLDESLDPDILRIVSRSTKGWKVPNSRQTRYDASLTRAWGFAAIHTSGKSSQS